MNARAGALRVALAVAGCASMSCGPKAGPSDPGGGGGTATTGERMDPIPTAPPVGSPVESVLLPTGSPIVSFRLVFRSGSVDDPAGMEGLTYLTALTIAEGGTGPLSYSDILDKLFPWAADLGVWIDKEQVTFVGRCHRDHLDEFYPILRDVLTKPRFDEKDFSRVRDKALNDLTKDLRTSDEENLGKAALEWALFEGHPYRHPVLGTARGLRAASLDAVKKHAAAMFTSSRLTVGLAGAVDVAFEGRVKADFTAGLPSRGKAPATIAVAATPSGRRVLLVDKPDARSTAISIGFPLPVTRADADFAALALVASYFGEHRQFHGVLFRSLREARGLNYGDYAYVENFIQEGWDRFPRTGVGRSEQLFSIWIRPVPTDKAHFALRAVMWNLENLVEKGLTKEAFERTREFLTGYTYLMEQTDMRRLGYRLDDRFYALPEPHYDRLRKAWAAMTVEDVNGAIKKYLRADDLWIAMVTKDAALVKEALVADAPSPIKYDAKPPAHVPAEDDVISKLPLRIRSESVVVIPGAAIFE